MEQYTTSRVGQGEDRSLSPRSSSFFYSHGVSDFILFTELVFYAGLFKSEAPAESSGVQVPPLKSLTSGVHRAAGRIGSPIPHTFRGGTERAAHRFPDAIKRGTALALKISPHHFWIAPFALV